MELLGSVLVLKVQGLECGKGGIDAGKEKRTGQQAGAELWAVVQECSLLSRGVYAQT